MNVKEIVNVFGSQCEMARILGGKILQSHVQYWIRHNKIPAQHCRALVCASGGKLTLHDIRPDLFDKGWKPKCKD